MVSEYKGRVFDWKSRHDPASRNYAVADVVRMVPKAPEKRSWKIGPILDQGREGACVGFGWAAELAASPARVTNINNTFARGIYKRAQALDEWEGETYEGTSVLAGAKACQELGLIGEYRWGFGIDDVRDAILQIGPVVIGIPWLDGMYETRPSGLVKVEGKVVGGHCILLTGFHPKMRIREEGWLKRHEVFTWQNSWSEEYGKRGIGFIPSGDLSRLLSDSGEACVPMRRWKVKSNV